MTMTSRAIAMFCYSLFMCLGAWADEQMRPLAIGGDWAAFQHSQGMTAAPDLCVAVNARANVGFRASETGVELRVSNRSWSLPAGVEGEIVIAVSELKSTARIGANTEDSVAAAMAEEDYVPLFAAMTKAPAMTIAVGKAKAINVSLAGSAKVMNAFRTCAGIRGNDHKGGENPFK